MCKTCVSVLISHMGTLQTIYENYDYSFLETTTNWFIKSLAPELLELSCYNKVDQWQTGLN